MPAQNEGRRCSDGISFAGPACGRNAHRILALCGVHRLILIGDHRQLPPIGAGRPFVDLVRRVAPTDVEKWFPCVGAGYAELTIRRRQKGEQREDRQLADWFSGNELPLGEDEVFDTVVAKGESEHIRFVERARRQAGVGHAESPLGTSGSLLAKTFSLRQKICG